MYESGNIRVLLISTGTGIVNRGFESFFAEMFAHTRQVPGMEIYLLKGAGSTGPNEFRAWCLPRTKWPAKIIGKLLKKPTNNVECVSAIPSAIRIIRKINPHVIYYADAAIVSRLVKRRDRIGVPFRTVLHNGGPMYAPFPLTDHIHQVTPFYVEQALKAGEPPERHSMIPLGQHVPPGPPTFDPLARTKLRRKLQLPVDRKIILSVGWIAQVHKRMHHLIREAAAMPQPRPFVMMLGAIDEQSPPIMKLAAEILGEGNYAIRSVPFAQVADYYQCADLFALCSLLEGFGLSYCEAMKFGLPVIAHQHEVMKFVVGPEGIFVDMDAPGELAAALSRELQTPLSAEAMARRRESVRQRLSWEQLGPQYRDMFIRAARGKSYEQYLADPSTGRVS